MHKALLLASALLSTVPLGAAELAGVTMEDNVTIGEQTLVLNGQGLRKKLFIKVYVAGLYLPAKETDAAKVLAADAPRRLEMSFLYGVGAGKLKDAWNEGLENNTPQASSTVQQGFEKLNGWMEDMAKGEQMVFTYLPGSGTEVTVKGESRGSIAGKGFADALFACWIGPEPPSADFKDGLLGTP